MSAKEFGGLAFAVGVVRGARSFRVADDGHLTGMVYREAWLPGENVASCKKPPFSEMGVTLSLAFNSLGYVLQGKPAPTRVAISGHTYELINGKWRADPAPPHAMNTCTCGYHAYSDGSDSYRENDSVSGVVEGYGEIVIGTRGFRAGKARIVAICLRKAETAPPVEVRTASGRLYEWMRRGGLPRARNFAYEQSNLAAGGLVGTLVACGLGIAITPVAFCTAAAIAVITIGLCAVARAATAAREDLHTEKLQLLYAPPVSITGVTTGQAAAIRRTYPGVPVFNTFEEMVAAYPPDLGDVITEETTAAEKDAA